MRFKITDIQANTNDPEQFDITVNFMNDNNTIIKTVTKTFRRDRFKAIEDLLKLISDYAKRAYEEYLMENYTNQTVAAVINKVYDVNTLQEII